MAADAPPVATLNDYLRILKRRKWIVIVPLILAPLVAVLIAKSQPKKYTANAQVLVSTQDISANLLNVSNPPQVDPVRFLATQAQFATLPPIASAALRAAGVRDLTPLDLLNASSVTPSDTSDFLTFTVTESNRALATRLATAYANAYVAYRRQYDTSQLTSARYALDARIRSVESRGGKGTALYHSLVDEANQLTSAVAVAPAVGSLVSVTGTSRDSVNVALDGALALVLGLVSGIGLAFVRDSLDTRVRSAEEMAGPLQLRLLARIPRPPRALRKTHQLVMRADPESAYAEPFQMLRTSLEFIIGYGGEERLNGGPPSPRAARQQGYRPKQPYRLMVTSAIEGEGKSTTVANLAVAFARAGRHVVLVDLDLRRPSQDRFFGLVDRPGLTDVVLGSEPASARSLIPEVDLLHDTPVDLNSYQPEVGRLRVMPLGTLLPHAVDASVIAGLGNILDELVDEADIVLIDSPPLLRVGDALALTSYVDGVLVVTSLRTLRAPMLTELRRVLDNTPVTKVGFVLTGAELESGYGYLSHRYQRRAANVG